MNLCTKCGSQNREQAKFCKKCGNIIEKSNHFTPPALSHNRVFIDDLDHNDIEYEDNYFGPPGREPFNKKRAIAKRMIRSLALTAATLTICPLPFSDIVFLIPIQCGMIMSIGKIYNTSREPEKIFLEIAAACGFSIFGELTALIISNFIPVIGKYLAAPYIYAWTCAIGELSIKYFESSDTTYEEMKDIFNEYTEKGQEDFFQQKNISKEEALDNLKSHLSKEEYDNIKRRFS